MGGPQLSVGDTVASKYRLEGTLSVGGLGVVFRASQLPLERPVALKVLHDELLTVTDLRTRFEREAKALASLTHPHIVAISDYGVDEGRPYLVMELLSGPTLEEVLEDGPMHPRRALTVMRQLLLGLAFSHQQEIAHRDLKPANVILTPTIGETDHLKLVDFGLARVRTDSPADVSLTQRGVIFGTPAYMSPEQASGAKADVRSDVYSAGVMFFELLTGRRPFAHTSRADLVRAHLSEDPPRLSEVRQDLRAPPALQALIARSLAKEPNDRFAHAGEMLAALDAIDEPSSRPRSSAELDRPRARHLRTIGAVAVLALVLGGGGALASALWPGSSEELVKQGTGLPADPFEQPVPDDYAPFYAMVESERVFRNHAELAPLYGLAQRDRDDPRPLLLLGHLFSVRGWLSAAMTRYERACRIDPKARGDRRMLSNLVAMVTRRGVGQRAASMVAELYGQAALPTVEAAIDSRQPPGAELLSLRDRLRAD